MKNLKYFAVVVMLLGIAGSAQGQFHRTVRGNHNVVKQDRNVGNFSGVRVSTAIDVYLTQGDKTSVVVETDENIQEYLVTEVKNDVLNIYFDASVLSVEVKKVYVTTKEINSLSTTSAGDIFGQNPIKTNNLKLNSSSAGDIKVEVYAGFVDANLSSSGDITLTGEADSMDASLSSAGDFNAYNFKVKQADVSASSAGNADIWVTEKLIARASSAGDINYKGDPEYVDAHSSSAGGIHKR